MLRLGCRSVPGCIYTLAFLSLTVVRAVLCSEHAVADWQDVRLARATAMHLSSASRKASQAWSNLTWKGEYTGHACCNAFPMRSCTALWYQHWQLKQYGQCPDTSIRRTPCSSHSEQGSLGTSPASMTANTGQSACALCHPGLVTTVILAVILSILPAYLHWLSANMTASDTTAAELGVLTYQLTSSSTSSGSCQATKPPGLSLQQLYQQAANLKAACASRPPAVVLHEARAARAARQKCGCWTEEQEYLGLVSSSSQPAGKVQGGMYGHKVGCSVPVVDQRTSRRMPAGCSSQAIAAQPAASCSAAPAAAAGQGSCTMLTPAAVEYTPRVTSVAAVSASTAVSQVRRHSSCTSSISGGVSDFNTDDEEFEGCAGDGLQGLQLGLLLGAGSFGRVYQGYLHGQLVAVKVFEVLQQREWKHICYEVAVNQMLQHPNIVRCLAHQVQPQVTSSCSLTVHGSMSNDSGVSQQRVRDQTPGAWQQALLVMEYCDRGSLHDAVMGGLLRSNIGAGACYSDMACVLQMALDVARGMAHMHSRNICHGDLCSKNVMLMSSPGVMPLGLTAKIADFGVSRMVPNSSSMVSTNTHGTLTHMAPELLLSQQLSPAADIYSFGVLLWELVHLGIALGDASNHGRGTVPAAAHGQQAAGQISASRSAVASACSQPCGGANSRLQPLTPTAAYGWLQSLQHEGAVCTRVYQHLGVVSPWAIMQHVVEGGRPVFKAPAVPGPYIALAQRCWHHQPQQRPPFSEIVELLEHVVQQDGHQSVESW